jgi:hypothetical protein
VEKITLLRFRRICKDPPPIKKGSSTSGNRHNAAKRRPNPTRNAKNLAHNFHSFIRLLAVVINFLPGWTAKAPNVDKYGIIATHTQGKY